MGKGNKKNIDRDIWKERKKVREGSQREGERELRDRGGGEGNREE